MWPSYDTLDILNLTDLCTYYCLETKGRLVV